ncbi:hypothetical protein [Pseudomonas fluorescens]|uniref:hypothetical protein n=1 Tax=Pseudomonas fluorescens TaxID=294 RepID=UPI0012B84EE0|nr:hypothetical protein [Pseudomonas fluorescens]
MKTKAKIAWAYLSEIILSATLTTLSCATYGFVETAKFVSIIASDVAAYVFSILLAGALALIWTIFSKTDSAFYNWLSSRGALNTFLQAFGYVVLVELLAVIFSILSKSIVDQNFLIVSAFIMFMGAINGLTMIANIFDLIKLNILFEQKHNNRPPL